MAHISHLIEDRDITLKEIGDIAAAAADGTLEGVTEKLDGVNIMYTCTGRYEVRAARSDSDIRSGGLHSSVLEARFAGRGLVQETFTKGINAVRHAVRAFSPKELLEAFDGGKLWYSAEIIHTANPNVVLYDHDAVVLHERPVLRLDGATVARDDGAFAAVERRVPDMDAGSWRVHGPQRLRLAPMTDRSDRSTLAELKKALRSMGKPASTLQSLLDERALHELAAGHGLAGQLLKDAAARLANAANAPSLALLRGRLPSRTVEALRASDEWAKRVLAPLDVAITRFSAARLGDATSALVANHDAEATRIRERVELARAAIIRSKNADALAILAKQTARLETDAISPVEGVVFPWGDRVYKLTGAFAPANAILGLCKYGRGKAIPPIGW